MMRKTLLTGCALGALLATLPTAADAQSYRGASTVLAGNAGISHAPSGGPGLPATTSILVLAPETVIEWRPVDALSSGAIDFQPTGTVATFQGDPSFTDYTVLNRIIPVDPALNPTAATVAFRGTTNALLVNNPGGRIWFYSPTGIITGPTARFNVGSLILTTNDIGFVPGDPGGSPPTPGSIYGPGGLVQFSGPAGSTSTVEIQAGTQINATGNSAYVALVAPRVVQRGLVQANGQIAYIAAEQVDMTINGGLFDFTITTGTEDTIGIDHSGTTTGPASTGLADAQRISMVALPKNDALTMLLAGSIGYTPAASAANDGSAIVLASGFDTSKPSSVPGNELGSINVANATFDNPLTAFASDTITVAPVAGTTFFDADSTLYATNAITMTAEAAEGVIATNLILNAGEPGTGGTIDVQALGSGAIQVGGNLRADASSSAATYVVSPVAINATGGAVTFLADGGSIEAAATTISAEAQGGFGDSLGGLGTGGTADLSVLNNGSLTFGPLDVSARGFGGPSALLGGDGIGGAVTISDLGGQLDFGTVLINADGTGGTGATRGGNGLGGTLDIAIANQAQSWTSLQVAAGAQAGLHSDPVGTTGSATASGDAIDLTVTGSGALALSGDAVLTANSYATHDNASGAQGQAGGIEVTAAGGGNLTIGGTLFGHASALIDGDGEVPNPVSTPVQTGGTVALLADGGAIGAANLDIAANALANAASETAGIATGGTATVSAINGGSIAVDNGLGTARLDLAADGLGAPGTAAGDAFGGTALLVARDGSVTVSGDALVSASGRSAEFPVAPGAGEGFTATGGAARVDLQAGAAATSSLAVNGLTVRANGDARLVVAGAPTAIDGPAGNGAAGTATLSITAGDLAAGAVAIEAIGTGGSSSTAAFGGEAAGGTARLALLEAVGSPGGTRNIASLTLDASGVGGAGTLGTAASDAGLVEIDADVANASSALTIAGALTATSQGSRVAAGAGIDVTVGGAPLEAGSIDFITSRDVAIAAAQPLRALGNVDIDGRAVNSTGLVDADGTLTISGLNGVTAERLASGGPTLLQAPNGSVTVSVDLASAGIVTALGRAVDITSLGALSFADLDAVAGDISIATGGNLTLFSADASGNVALASNTGSVFASGPVSAGGGSTITAPLGVTLAYLQSRDATLLQATGGTIDVDNLISGGPVTALGSSIDIGSAASLSFADLDATAGPLSVVTSGALTLATVDGASTVMLGSILEAVRATGSIIAGSDATVTAPLGVALASLTSGGTTLLRASGGTVDVDSLLSTGPVTAQGRAIDIVSPGSLTFADLDATAGPLSVTTAGDLAVSAVDSTAALLLSSTGGSVTATGAVFAGGPATVTGPGGVTLAFLRSGAATMLGSTAGTVDIDTLVSFGPVSVTANAVDIVGSGPLTFTTAQSTTRMAIAASGDLAFGTVGAGGNLTLASTNGSLRATGDVAGAATSLAATGDIALDGTLRAAGPLTVTAGGRFTVAGLASANSVNLVANGGIALATLQTGGDPVFQATNGAISVTNLLTFGRVTATGRDIALGSTGSLFVGDANATAGNVRVQSTGELVVDRITATGSADLRTTNDYMRSVGTVTAGTINMAAFGRIEAANLAASGALTADAGQSFILSGLARGATVSILSSDLALGATAQIGQRGLTQDVLLTNRNAAATTFVGGAGQASGYSLQASEALRLFADRSIEIASPGNVTVDDLALSFSGTGNIGAGGTLELTTPARVAIIGDVALATNSAADTFLIDPTRIELDSSTGSIAMLGAGGAPLGRLALTGGAVAVGTTATLAQLQTLTDFTAINDLLDTPGGIAEPLRAGTVQFSVNEGLYIQNSGATELYQDRRGFTAGGIAITTAAPTTRIAINGQILTAAGPVSGLNTQSLVTINGAAAAAGGQFDARSTINGCVIGGTCAPPPGSNPPSETELTDPLPPGNGSPSLIVAPLIELAGTDPLIEPPLVDEPITGVGNDDLWEPHCAEPDEDGACPEADRQP